jgi:hypothetical protein
LGEFKDEFSLVFRSTLVVKIKKSRNPLRAFKKKATEDKENIVLLPVASPLSEGPCSEKIHGTK